MAVDTVVVHDTGGTSLSGALSTLRARGLSYHYLIDRDGRIVKAAPISGRAFHAGESLGPHGKDVNDYSIGIALVHPSDGITEYSRLQIDALKELIRLLDQAMELQWVTSHAEISYPRKIDSRYPLLDQVAASLGLRYWRRKAKEAD